MSKNTWWKDGIIYQIYPRSYADSNHDGLGDLPGIISHLDYLEDLGVDAIWLSPVYPSPQADFGYDVSNYCNIDSLFGTLSDYDCLVKEAHRRKIHVIMDLVLNHTSDEHPWFMESRQSRNNPFRDWYIWRDPNPKGGPPNNWSSVFGGRAWKFDPATGQYYLHLFHEKQPDLNWRNPKVEAEMLQVLKFWLDRGTDGFRLDVFNAYFKHAEFPDNPVTKFGLRGFERQDHIYDTDQPEMIPLLQKFRKLLDSYPDRYAVGETFFSTPQKAAMYCGNDRLHAAFNFTLLECKWNPTRYRKAILDWESATGSRAWPNYVLNNHDNPRSVTRWKDDDADSRARLAITMLLTLRGTPFLYYGEEIGMRDLKVRRNEIMDPPGKRYWPFYKGRDGCRSPMQWDACDLAGFSDTQPWLRVNPDYLNRNVTAQIKDPGSLLNVYKKLIELRRELEVLSRGDFKLLDQNNSHCLVYLRTYGKNQTLILLNFSNKTQRLVLGLPEPLNWIPLFSTHDLPEERIDLHGLILAPFQASILEPAIID